MKTNWDDCFQIPLWIKDIKQKKTDFGLPSEDINEILPITSLYNTILEAAHVTSNKNNKSFLKLIRKSEESCPVRTKPSFYVDLMTKNALEKFSFADTKNFNNTDVFGNVTNESRDQKDDVIVDQSVTILFHYYNVEKPVMLTFEEGYKVIYYYLDGKNF